MFSSASVAKLWQWHIGLSRNETTLTRLFKAFKSTVSLTPKISLPQASRSQMDSKFKSTITEGEYSTTPAHDVPLDIVRPPYVMRQNGIPAPLTAQQYGEIKNIDAICKMRKAGSIAASALQLALDNTKPGVQACEVERVVHDYIVSMKAYPSPLGFHNFPNSLVISVNEACCHGIPNTRPFKNGDIVKYDCIVYFDGYHGDCAATIAVGKVSSDRETLITTCRTARDEAIRLCKPGTRLNTIGDCISEIAGGAGFGVIDSFSGHFIGHEMHMLPLVRHTRNKDDFELQPGHCFTIEPILVEGSTQLVGWKDGWTVVAKDNSFSAQWEHTIVITEKGCEVLTPLRDEKQVCSCFAAAVSNFWSCAGLPCIHPYQQKLKIGASNGAAPCGLRAARELLGKVIDALKTKGELLNTEGGSERILQPLAFNPLSNTLSASSFSSVVVQDENNPPSANEPILNGRKKDDSTPPFISSTSTFNLAAESMALELPSLHNATSDAQSCLHDLWSAVLERSPLDDKVDESTIANDP